MSEGAYLTYYQGNRDLILNRTKDYYENGKERLRKQARYKYRNLSQETKNKKREYGRKNRCLNISEEKKKGLKESQKDYHEAEKSKYNNESNRSLITILISCTLLNPCIYVILDGLTERKA